MAANPIEVVNPINNHDPHRTAYHFQPPRNWMNDPNGPCIYNGIYHLFYQYNPNAPHWERIVWGHSTSTDLINWTFQPIAFSPIEPYEIRGCWSGSTTIIPCEQPPGEMPAILYTAGDENHHQVQVLAFPKDVHDPHLVEWVKVPQNPVIVAPPNNNNIDPLNLRDPSTAWKLPKDKKWRTIIGTHRGNCGSLALFTSDNFINWEDAGHPFHSVNETTGVWECPELFPVYVGRSIGVDTSKNGDEDVKHVLKISLTGAHCDMYTFGRYDTEEDIYIPDEGSIESHLGLLLDYGRFYAAKSFFDSTTDRRIIFGWVNDDASHGDDVIARGWAGLQGIPRTIVPDTFGRQLVQWPIAEIETLRTNEVNWSPQVIRSGPVTEITGVTAHQADVEISFKIPSLEHVEEFDPEWTDPQTLCSKGTTEGVLGPFGILTLASTDLEEYTAVFFRIFKAPNKYVVFMCSDQSRSSTNPTTDKISYGTFVDVDPVNDELSLRILIDHSIVESFGAKGKSCITARVYPKKAVNEDAKMYAFNYGTEAVEITKLTAWSMNAAQVNQLNPVV